MLWSDRNKKPDDDSELPAELKGKKPEEIVAEMKRLDAAAREAETKRLQLEADGTARATEFEQMKTRLAELEANKRPEIETTTTNEPPSIWEDPAKFIQEQTKETSAVALAAGIMSAKTYAMGQMSARDLKIFKKYEAEVEKVVMSFAPVQRVMPGTWMNSLIFIKGNHDVEIAKAEAESTDFFAERGSEGRRVQTDDSPDNMKLTPEEEQVCRTFKYDPKKYLETKKQSVLKSSGKGQYSSYAVPTTTNAE